MSINNKIQRRLRYFDKFNKHISHRLGDSLFNSGFECLSHRLDDSLFNSGFECLSHRLDDSLFNSGFECFNLAELMHQWVDGKLSGIVQHNSNTVTSSVFYKIAIAILWKMYRELLKIYRYYSSKKSSEKKQKTSKEFVKSFEV